MIAFLAMRVSTRHFESVDDVEAAYRTPDEAESTEERRMRKARRRAALARFRVRQRERASDQVNSVPPDPQAVFDTAGGVELPTIRSGRSIEEVEADYDSPDTYEPPNERRKRVARRGAAMRRLRARSQRDESKEAEEEKVDEVDLAVPLEHESQQDEGDEGHDQNANSLRARLQRSDDDEDENNEGVSREAAASATSANGSDGTVVQRERNTASQAARRLRMPEAARTRQRQVDARAHVERRAALPAVLQQAMRAAHSTEQALYRERMTRSRAIRSHGQAVKSIEEFDPNFAAHALGHQVNVCQYCDALLWVNESSSMCCVRGNVKLDPLPQTPPRIRALWASPAFRRQARSYNSVFAFTSMGASLSENVRLDHQFANGSGGVYTFRIQGTICHRIGSLLPPSDRNPAFAQIYV